MTEESYLLRAINWVKRKGYSQIKANHDGFEEPTNFLKSKGKKPFIPDITAKKSGRKSYFEVATKSDNFSRKISKWNLLSTLAQMKGGHFYLLAPKGHKAFVERMMKKYNLNAKLIYMPNIS